MYLKLPVVMAMASSPDFGEPSALRLLARTGRDFGFCFYHRAVPSHSAKQKHVLLLRLSGGEAVREEVRVRRAKLIGEGCSSRDHAEQPSTFYPPPVDRLCGVPGGRLHTLSLTTE